MNPEKDQDRCFDTMDHYKRFGQVMFTENKKTYENIASRISGRVLEAGCGMGLGSAILERRCESLLATDKLLINTRFAKELYPWIHFETWDLNSGPFKEKVDTVVCVEAVEHVGDPIGAIKNLIASANKHVWFSTPNNYDPTPSNPFHVREYTTEEIVDALKDFKVEIHHWNTMDLLSTETKVSPVIYHIIL